MKKTTLSLKDIKLTFVFALSLLILASCKKDDVKPDVEPPAQGTRTELTADSIFLYAKQVYLWYEHLPSYDDFNPRQYVNESDEEAGFNRELFAITRYGVNPVTGRPYEYDTDFPQTPRYSYIHNSDNDNPIAFAMPTKSSVDLEGNGFDFGFQIGLYWVNPEERTYAVVVQAVYKGSPAEKAGIRRGDVFTMVNNRQTTSYTSGTEEFLNRELFDATSVELTVVSPNGRSRDIELERRSYRSSPIYRDSVYSSGSKKVGYLAYARFSSLDNSKSVLDASFSRFQREGVTDLIIDLRYNGGGYVTTAEYLMNLIAPRSIDGQLMYKEHYNELVQNKKAPLLEKQFFEGTDGKDYSYADIDFSLKGDFTTAYFEKRGPLGNIRNVVFIVTGNTASASELVINSLKPYLNVTLVGEKTYGKPVGFFPITIDKYEVYFSMFESRNKNDEGGYYQGMEVNRSAADDVLSDFGDLDEASLRVAYNYLVGGSSGSGAARTMSTTRGKAAPSKELKGFKPSREEFKGLIKDNIHRK